MKSKKTLIFLFVIPILILAAGCAKLPTSNATVSALPSFTSLPVKTEVLTLTSTPAPAFTPTAIPTLPVEAARTQLLALLAENNHCRLPCLWGITPGKSTFQDARSILSPLSSISSELMGFGPEGGTINPSYTESDLELNTIASFDSDAQIVSSLYFRARELKKWEKGINRGVDSIFDSKIFGERIQPYTLPSILNDQGVPASVLISTHTGASLGMNVEGFYVVLLYPNKGILARYSTYQQLVLENVHGCLANAHVELKLSIEGNGDSFIKNLDSTWQDIISGYKPLEEVTSLTLEQFYETFRQPTDQCIETPAKLWPTPEP